MDGIGSVGFGTSIRPLQRHGWRPIDILADEVIRCGPTSIGVAASAPSVTGHRFCAESCRPPIQPRGGNPRQRRRAGSACAREPVPRGSRRRPTKPAQAAGRGRGVGCRRQQAPVIRLVAAMSFPDLSWRFTLCCSADGLWRREVRPCRSWNRLLTRATGPGTFRRRDGVPPSCPRVYPSSSPPPPSVDWRRRNRHDGR